MELSRDSVSIGEQVRLSDEIVDTGQAFSVCGALAFFVSGPAGRQDRMEWIVFRGLPNHLLMSLSPCCDGLEAPAYRCHAPLRIACQRL